MKSSQKILITTAGMLIAILIVGLVFLRNQVKELITRTQLEYNYQTLQVENIRNLDFSGDWIVKIRQGRDDKIEVGFDGDLKPEVQNIQGTIYFKPDTTLSTSFEGKLYAKITAHSLKKIRAVNGTKIEMKRFHSDSLSVTLENSSVFTGDNNKIDYASYKTLGEVWLNIIDNLND